MKQEARSVALQAQTTELQNHFAKLEAAVEAAEARVAEYANTASENEDEGATDTTSPGASASATATSDEDGSSEDVRIVLVSPELSLPSLLPFILRLLRNHCHLSPI